jgi:nucleotide-binding universal stress UspA family protein
MSDPIRTIVVGVASMDDQDPRTPGDADPVLGPAVRLAAALGAELHAVHAYEVPGELLFTGPGGGWSPGAAARPASPEAELEARMERQLAAIPGGDAVHCRAVQGSAADALCRAAAQVDADLLVVGASRRGRAWAGILGSTASRVIAAAAIPVLVVHRPFARRPGRVLLTSDLSASGRHVLRRGAETARLVNGGVPELRCVHVVDLDTLIAPPAADGVLEAAASAMLARGLDEAGFVPGAVERRVRVGDAAREINREALEWGAELLVVGTHGHAGAEPLRIGHVAMATVRGASCNVLVIPAGTAGAASQASPWSDARSASGAVPAAL